MLAPQQQPVKQEQHQHLQQQQSQQQPQAMDVGPDGDQQLAQPPLVAHPATVPVNAAADAVAEDAERALAHARGTVRGGDGVEGRGWGWGWMGGSRLLLSLSEGGALER
jgi:hypothetical protein